MRVVLAGQAYFREDNGQAVFTVRLARELARRGHAVMVLAPSDNGCTGRTRVDGIELQRVPALRLPYNANISLGSGQVILQAIRSFDPDIIHLQDHYFLCRTVYRAGKKHHIPTVGTNHFLPENITANLHLPHGVRDIADRLLWLHMRSLYDRLAAVTAPTMTGVRILRNRQVKAPMIPISCGIETSRFRPLDPQARRRARARLNLDPEASIFIYVGRLDHEKGLDTVVEAFARVEPEGSRLVLAGKGSFQPALEKMCAALGLEGRVSFPGFVSAEDLPLLLGCADCFLMAGFAELQSIATLEAMACGLPVLAANARALPELVTHGKNGLLFAPRDSDSLGRELRSFLAQPEWWQAWGRESWRRSRAHSIQTTADRYCSWYQSVMT